MYFKPDHSARRMANDRQLLNKPSKRSSWISLLIVAVLAIWAIGLFNGAKAHAAAQTIKSGISGYCLDQADNQTVDTKKCADVAAQDWSVDGFNILNSKNCLGVSNDGTQSSTGIVSAVCNGSAGQVWLRDQNGYQNPNSGLCLSVVAHKPSNQLVILSCNPQNNQLEQWFPVLSNGSSYAVNCNSGDKDEKIACYAGQEWSRWQTGNPSHQTLLNLYSGGNGYEEWCADFVSYVYKEAGYPFTQGERDGWDEYDANNIQNQGFTQRDMVSYIPKPGDLAYFNYSAGHVEIVISGGAHPTFIYGDSATTDPTTGNGDMKANTITSEGSLGQLQYYLSPN